MIQKTKNILNANTFFLVCFSFVLVQLVSYFFPTSFWYEAHTFRVQDAYVGQPIKIAIDRTINRPFIGHRTVIVRRVNGGSSEVVCSGAGATAYAIDSELPETLTLMWWSNGACQKLEAGFYRATTFISINVPNILQPKTVTIESNIFEIKP